MRITAKGGIFSIDLLFAFLLLCIMLSFAVQQESSMLLQNSESISHSLLEEKALFAADALVKRHDLNNSLFGAAFFDSEKLRVVDNLVELSSLRSARPECFGSNCAVELSARGNGFDETFFSQIPAGSECLAVSRFAFLKETSQKALLKVIVCEE